MSHTADRIHALLSAEFTPVALNVTDDSAKHAGHVGARPEGETHFSVCITSEKFKGIGRVARHRAIYTVLTPLFDEGLHALAIEAKAPGE